MHLCITFYIIVDLCLCTCLCLVWPSLIWCHCEEKSAWMMHDIKEGMYITIILSGVHLTVTTWFIVVLALDQGFGPKALDPRPAAVVFCLWHVCSA